MYGIRIKELRKIKNLTQQELANKLNVDNTTISIWELEKAQPDIDTLIKLAKIFNVTTDYLLGLESKISERNIPPKENTKTVLSVKQKTRHITIELTEAQTDKLIKELKDFINLT